MAKEIISKRTRNRFREFLVGWTLGEIEIEFDSAGIKRDAGHDPGLSGQRRSFVEQHYHALDLTKPADARRLLDVFENILVRAERGAVKGREPAVTQDAIAELVELLEKDGFERRDGKLVATAPSVKQALDEDPATHSVSEVTRRGIFHEIRVGVNWAGDIPEEDFVGRLVDAVQLESPDHRLESMKGDVWQHRVRNFDWEDDWILVDSRLDLLRGPDSTFLRFLCEIVHPVVRRDTEGAKVIVAKFNRHLRVDGWELVAGKTISERPVFEPRRRSGVVRVAPTSESHDVLSDEYVQELVTKCESRLATKDFDGSVTLARTLVEAILSELERRIAGAVGDYKGDLQKQYKHVAKLLRMDDERPDLDERFKDVVRGLVTVINGLAPLRNKISDGHARVRKPAQHHAHLVVNAARTVAVFLVESYSFQCQRGLLGQA